MPAAAMSNVERLFRWRTVFQTFISPRVASLLVRQADSSNSHCSGSSCLGGTRFSKANRTCDERWRRTHLFAKLLRPRSVHHRRIKPASQCAVCAGCSDGRSFLVDPGGGVPSRHRWVARIARNAAVALANPTERPVAGQLRSPRSRCRTRECQARCASRRRQYRQSTRGPAAHARSLCQGRNLVSHRLIFAVPAFHDDLRYSATRIRKGPGALSPGLIARPRNAKNFGSHRLPGRRYGYRPAAICWQSGFRRKENVLLAEARAIQARDQGGRGRSRLPAPRRANAFVG
jgi:hypothetical protein